MSGRRSYNDPCGVARALDLVGERWALLVVRELLLGPRRFSDLHRGLPSASQNVLSQRLRELDAAGVVRRRRLGPPAGVQVYELTEWGRELEPALLLLGRWGGRAPITTTAAFGADSLVLGLRTVFVPAAAAGLRASYELRIGDQRFRAEIADGVLDLARGEADRPDAVIDTDDTAAFQALAFAGLDPDEALRSGRLRVEGDLEAARRFFGLFAVQDG